VEPAAVRLSDGDHGRVGLRLEIEDVPFADEAVADKADADAIIGAGNALVACSCERGSAGGKKNPPVHRFALFSRRSGLGHPPKIRLWRAGGDPDYWETNVPNLNEHNVFRRENSSP